MAQTRGQILLQKLYERDAANPDQRTRFSSTIVEFTPETPDPIVALVKGDSVQEFIAKHEATRPKDTRMSDTKQSIWARIEAAAAAVTVAKDEDGITPSTEQATSRYLEAHPAEYEAWRQAPWAEQVQKSEDDQNSADYHLSQAVKKLKAERRAGLEKLAAADMADAEAHTAKKAARSQ